MSIKELKKEGSVSPRPLQPRIAGSTVDYHTGFVRLSAPNVTELKGPEMYSELDLVKGSESANRLIFGEKAMRKKAIQAERTMLKRSQDEAKRTARQTEIIRAEKLRKEREQLIPLNCHGTVPGRVQVGKGRKSEVVTRVPPTPEPAPKEKPSCTESSTEMGVLAPVTTNTATNSTRSPPNRQHRKNFRRLTAAMYADNVLNGGRYDPPSESLMEEVNRQREREAAVRAVGMFESSFFGTAVSPLGEYGKRFHKKFQPLSVEQIERYRNEGRKRPLLMDGDEF